MAWHVAVKCAECVWRAVALRCLSLWLEVPLVPALPASAEPEKTCLSMDTWSIRAHMRTHTNTHTHTHTLKPSCTFKHDNVCVPHTSRQPIANLLTLTLCLLSCLFVRAFTWSICHVCASVCLCHVLTICPHRTEDLKHISLRSTSSLSLSARLAIGSRVYIALY